MAFQYAQCIFFYERRGNPVIGLNGVQYLLNIEKIIQNPVSKKLNVQNCIFAKQFEFENQVVKKINEFYFKSYQNILLN